MQSVNLSLIHQYMKVNAILTGTASLAQINKMFEYLTLIRGPARVNSDKRHGPKSSDSAQTK